MEEVAEIKQQGFTLKTDSTLHPQHPLTVLTTRARDHYGGQRVNVRPCSADARSKFPPSVCGRAPGSLLTDAWRERGAGVLAAVEL